MSLIPEDDEPTAPFWMATFSDMMTLLLAFFVMLVAMSSVEVKKFEEALSYFTGRSGVMEEDGSVGSLGVAPAERPREQAETFEEIARQVQEQGLGAAVELDLTERGLRVTFADSIGFAPGSAALDGPAQTVLRVVAAGARAAHSVEVEGHTDTVPIATSAYPSNWELSAARAAAVVRFLAADSSGLAPDRYAAVGYGEHRPRAPNEIPEGRARNRRISVLFHSGPAAVAADLPVALPFDV